LSASYVRVISAGNKFAAYVYGNKIAYSSDGISGWTVVDNILSFSILELYWYGPAGQEKFIAIEKSPLEVKTSPDGITWTSIDMKNTSGTKLISNELGPITYGGPIGQEKYIMGGQNKIMYSSNGIDNWTDATQTGGGIGGFFSSNWCNGIIWDGSKFVAHSVGRSAVSTDGINWQVNQNALGNNPVGDMQEMAYGGGKFVSAGRQNGTISFTTTGLAWTNVYKGTTGVDPHLRAIAYGNKKFVAAGEKGLIMYSNDQE
jgi:hypothetical protein